MTIRADSILPAIAFHVVYNGLEVLRGHASGMLTQPVSEFYLATINGQLHYTLPSLIVAALLVSSGMLGVWLAPEFSMSPASRPTRMASLP
jgi:hypothetical protein